MQAEFRKAAIDVSPGAVERVRRVAGRESMPYVVLRLKRSGCSGFKYEMTAAARAPSNVAAVACGDVWLLVDPLSELFLFGAQVDVEADAFGERFVFTNPNERSACGCGLSVGF